MRCILSLITLGVLVLLGDQSWARRDALTAEQKSQLERIDRVLVDVIALSDKGSLDAKPLVDVVVTRMKEFDYTTVTDPAQPHDVELKTGSQTHCQRKAGYGGTSDPSPARTRGSVTRRRFSR